MVLSCSRSSSRTGRSGTWPSGRPCTTCSWPRPSSTTTGSTAAPGARWPYGRWCFTTGTGPWNAPTRLADLFVESAPDTYKVVSRKPAGGSPPVPLDLPEMVLRLGHDWTPEVLRSELPRLWRVIEDLGDEHFDQFMAETLKEVLISEGYSSQQLEEAMTMGTVKTAFQRGLEDIDQQGFRRGRKEGHEKGQARLLRRQVTRRFGPETAGELSRLLARRTDPGLAARAADAILDCDSAEEFLARVRQG